MDWTTVDKSPVPSRPLKISTDEKSVWVFSVKIFRTKITESGSVTFFNRQLLKLIGKLTVGEAYSIGQTLSRCGWRGITDLHEDNIACGRRDGKFYVIPIDVECLFEDITLLSQALLLPWN